MISLAFWDKLTPDLQKIMTDLWAREHPTYRANMAAAQSKARATLRTRRQVRRPDRGANRRRYASR